MLFSLTAGRQSIFLSARAQGISSTVGLVDVGIDWAIPIHAGCEQSRLVLVIQPLHGVFLLTLGLQPTQASRRSIRGRASLHDILSMADEIDYEIEIVEAKHVCQVRLELVL